MEKGGDPAGVKTEAYEYKYSKSGEVEYQFHDEHIRLRTGDSMLFDGRLPHTPRNIGSDKAVILVIYFFEGED